MLKILLIVLIFLTIPISLYCSEIEILKERYSLKTNETVKYFKYPYDEIRNSNIQLFTPYLSKKDLKRENSVYFEFSNDSLIQKSTTSGPSNLKMIINNILPYNYTDIIVDTSILNIQLTGDFIFRPQASKNDLITDLQAIFLKETNHSINLSPILIEKEVVVATGECRFIPIKEHPQDTLFIYLGERPDKLKDCCPKSSKPVKLNDFITSLSFSINKPIINEIPNSEIIIPIFGICSRPVEEEQIKSLLLNVSNQLQINFNIENRNVEVLKVTN